MKWLIILWLLLGVASASEHDKKEHHLSKDLSYLELSEPQQESAKGIIKTYRHDLKQYRDFKEGIEKQKEQLFSENTLNEEALLRLQTSIYQKANAVENRFLLQMHQLLTPKQREKFAHNLEEWEVE